MPFCEGAISKAFTWMTVTFSLGRPCRSAYTTTPSILKYDAEGPQATIGRIEISGNDKTKDYVIRRELRTIPGEKFSRPI
jgi:hypothetical protein